MKPLHWDMLSVDLRLKVLRQFSFEDMCEPDENSEDVRQRLAVQSWAELPPDIQQLIRQIGA